MRRLRPLITKLCVAGLGHICLDFVPRPRLTPLKNTDIAHTDATVPTCKTR